MGVYLKIVDKITVSARIVVEFAIVAIMLLTVVDVILRHTVKVSILGVTEYSQMLMSVILLATGYTGMQDGHVKVDIVYNAIPSAAKKTCVIVTSLFSAFISAVIASRSYMESVRALHEMQMFTTLQIVKWPFFLVFAISMTILCLAAIGIILKTILDIRKKGGQKDE